MVADPPTQTQVQTPVEEFVAEVRERLGNIEKYLGENKGRFIDVDRLFREIEEALPERCGIVYERDYEEWDLDLSARHRDIGYRVEILDGVVVGRVVCIKRATGTADVARITLRTYSLRVVEALADTVTDTIDVLAHYHVSLAGEDDD